MAGQFMAGQRKAGQPPARYVPLRVNLSFSVSAACLYVRFIYRCYSSGKISIGLAMPVDEGLNIDLQFLILEVKKQARASASVIDNPTTTKIKKVNSREKFIDNLKNTLESKSYFNIHRQEEGRMNHFKAVITIASNLKRMADFFNSISSKMSYVEDSGAFVEFDLKRYYQVIYKALDAIYPALLEQNLETAQALCDYEQVLDDYYDETTALVQLKLSKRGKVSDLMILLTIIQYLERVGDNLLNIGEAILDIHVGEKLGILQYRNLKKGLEGQNIKLGDSSVAFKRIMNTRSGCRVARIISTPAEGDKTSIFYKEGDPEKIAEEVDGLRLWQEQFPGLTPQVLWHRARKDSATILLEYIEGQDLLNILINDGGKLDQALDLLAREQTNVWKSSIKRKSVKTNYVGQLLRRKNDIESVHPSLFESSHDLSQLIKAATKIERMLPAPFSTLIHGDFNADNVIFQLDESRMYYVDVHRSGFGDYVQDVSVFLVSNFRVPIFSPDIRQRLNAANQRMYDCAADYAKKQKDQLFDARLALGLFRSLVTSTRFVFDQAFSYQLMDRAAMILQDLKSHEDNLKKFKMNTDLFLYR
ncbi:MAG: phosphate uptake regulator [Candidatus Azotimanducaceae bacterium]|jgi:phosphate uptake regulator